VVDSRSVEGESSRDGTVNESAGSMRRTGVLAGAGAYLIWGLFPLYYYRLRAIGALELACLRIVLASASVWIVLVAKRDLSWWRPLVADRRRLANVALAGLMVTTNWLVYVWAAANERVVEAAIGYFINPLISVALGVFVLHERLRHAQKFALMLGAVAVAVLTVAYGNVPWVSLTLACSFGLYGYLKKATGLTGVRALAAETLLMMPVGIVGLAWLALRPQGLDITSVRGTTMALALTVGIVTAVPLTMFGVAATRIPLALLGLLQYLTPVGQLLCAVLVLNEKVSSARWFGIALVGAALVVLATDLINDLRPSRPVELAA
jgi:chloramphenicol-sensitive protein RarD